MVVLFTLRYKILPFDHQDQTRTFNRMRQGGVIVFVGRPSALSQPSVPTSHRLSAPTRRAKVLPLKITSRIQQLGPRILLASALSVYISSQSAPLLSVPIILFTLHHIHIASPSFPISPISGLHFRILSICPRSSQKPRNEGNSSRLNSTLIFPSLPAEKPGRASQRLSQPGNPRTGRLPPGSKQDRNPHHQIPGMHAEKPAPCTRGGEAGGALRCVANMISRVSSKSKPTWKKTETFLF